MKKFIKNQQGFTLVEILIVIVVLSVILTFALPNFGMQRERGNLGEARSTLIALLGAQNRHALENGAYTTVLANLDITINPSTVYNVPQVDTDINALASLTRAGQYTLSITEAGVINCANITPDICGKLGF